MREYTKPHTQKEKKKKRKKENGRILPVSGMWT